MKREAEIDIKRNAEFTIASAYAKAAKGRRQYNLKCEVEHFERGSDLGIKDWIEQIETHFQIWQVPSETFVPFMLMKIASQHLNEIKQHKHLDYLAFREKLIEVFEKPDLATAYLNKLSSISQYREETISDYMRRVRRLVNKAHPDLAQNAREQILVTSYLLGLYDRHIASSLAVAKIKDSS